MCTLVLLFVFFFNDTATTEIYTLSLHDALPIYDYNESVKAHNSVVMEYQEWTAGKTFITGTEETERMQEWYQEMKDEEDRLDALSDASEVERNSLRTFWGPMGVVTSVGVCW